VNGVVDDALVSEAKAAGTLAVDAVVWKPSVAKRQRKKKPPAPKDPNAVAPPKRTRSKKKQVIDPNEGNRAVESLDLEGLADSTVGSEDVEVHPDLYHTVHDQLTNETVYVLQDAYNSNNAQVYHQPLHNQHQPQAHTMMTRSQQVQYQMQQQQMAAIHPPQPQPQPIVVIGQNHHNNQHHHHQQQHQVQHHHQQQQVHHHQPATPYGLFLQPAPVLAPIEGDCKLCGIHDRDIRHHYVGFHKIPEDKAHFFMAM
jgi:hypothetical protein